MVSQVMRRRLLLIFLCPVTPTSTHSALCRGFSASARGYRGVHGARGLAEVKLSLLEEVYEV